MKMHLTEAMSYLGWAMFDEEYEEYLYCLTPEEETDEEELIRKAIKIVSKYPIGFAEIYKHRMREQINFEMNYDIPPEKFIDRVHLRKTFDLPPVHKSFVSIDSDQLPF